eukprot:gene10017-6994_t
MWMLLTLTVSVGYRVPLTISRPTPCRYGTSPVPAPRRDALYPPLPSGSSSSSTSPHCSLAALCVTTSGVSPRPTAPTGVVLLRISTRCASSASFSSADFTGDSPGSGSREQQEAEANLREQRERLRREHQGQAPRPGAAASSSSSSSSSTSFSKDGRASFTYRPGEDEAPYADLTRPTRATYESMTDEELVELLKTREGQVEKLRAIYERFHYEVDKHLRRTVLDYHDKAMQLSQVHGQMQHSSLRINREALSKLREEQEMLTRDKRLVFFLCVVFTACFWVWVRRHYIRKEELETAMAGSAASITARGGQRETAAQAQLRQRDGDDSAAKERSSSALSHERMQARVAPSVTGAGYYGGGNWFGSEKRSARYRETAWEREQREKMEQLEAEHQHSSQKLRSETREGDNDYSNSVYAFARRPNPSTYFIESKRL